MYKIVLALFVLTAISGSHANSRGLGECPDIAPMPNLEMKKMLGDWYVIQKSSTFIRCLKFTFKEVENKEGHYQFIQTEPSSPLWMSALYHEVHTVGSLTTPNVSIAAKMHLDLPLPDIGITKFTIFMSDYEHYAAVFACKDLPLNHKYYAAILSRSPEINMDYVDKIRTRLSSYNIDPFTLSIIEHKHCPAPGSKGVVLQSASDVIHSVGNKIHNVIHESDHKSKGQ